jgi:modification methylase
VILSYLKKYLAKGKSIFDKKTEMNNNTVHKIIFADSRDMAEVPSKSVHLIITSPPYWQLKDYGDNGQIGFNDSYEKYINNLNLVWSECQRILHDGCRLCINIGDQFARAVYYGRYKVIPIRTEIIKFCESIGFDYMGAIIWQKVTTCNTTGGATIMGSFPYPRNGIIKIDYEFILIFKKGGIPPKVSRDAKENSKLSIEEWNEYFSGHWNFPGEKQDKHLAMFPEELPRRLIKMFSFFGETVLDPFLGSGTTALAAKNLGRYFIGYEINKEYEPVIKHKLGNDQNELLHDAVFHIIKPERTAADYSAKILNLPYVFHDNVKVDKKIDPKSLRFGSRIDGKTDCDKNQNSLRLKKIVAPNIVELSGGTRARLIGVKAVPFKEQDAASLLEKYLKGEKLFLKFDEHKHDEKNNLLVYLYLSNKTFVNMHLLKSGLFKIDENYPFRYLNKFRAIQNRSMLVQ